VQFNAHKSFVYKIVYSYYTTKNDFFNNNIEFKYKYCKENDIFSDIISTFFLLTYKVNTGASRLSGECSGYIYTWFQQYYIIYFLLQKRSGKIIK